jgi:hypothetical protein
MPRTLTQNREIWGAGQLTDFDVAAAELVVAAEAGEEPGVPGLPRRGGDGLAHDDGDPVGAALDGVLRRGKRLLVRGGRGQEGAGLLVAVGGGAHGGTAGGASEIGEAVGAVEGGDFEGAAGE